MPDPVKLVKGANALFKLFKQRLSAADPLSTPASKKYTQEFINDPLSELRTQGLPHKPLYELNKAESKIPAVREREEKLLRKDLDERELREDTIGLYEELGLPENTVIDGDALYDMLRSRFTPSYVTTPTMKDITPTQKLIK